MILLLLILYAILLCHFADPIVKWSFRRAAQWRVKPDHYLFHSVQHGPRSWPWWRLVSVSIVKASMTSSKRRGYNVWVYTRWAAWCCGIYERKLP